MTPRNVSVSVSVDQAKLFMAECGNALIAIEKGERIPNERAVEELYVLLARACNKVTSDAQVIKSLNDAYDDVCKELVELQTQLKGVTR